MKIKLLMTLLFAMALLAACSEMNPHPMDMSQAVQDATTKADHEALAKHYDEAANEMKLKVEEHKKLFNQYQAKSYLYGKQAEDIKSHCEALIHVYQKAEDANEKMAKIHRGLAH